MSRRESTRLAELSQRVLKQWLIDCTRSNKLSRNTLAAGIVVVDHLLRRCPLAREDVFARGGELKGARSSLSDVLDRHGIPRSFLKEVTTRQAGPDAQRLLEQLEWGTQLTRLGPKKRKDILTGMIATIRKEVTTTLKREKLKVEINRRETPTTWIRLILQSASGRSTGVVEQHLIGAKLERRFNQIKVPNHPAHAADAQTLRKGDFVIARLVYHVTANPSRGVIDKCVSNAKTGLSPILLVPSEQTNRARFLAEEAGIEKELTVLSIEDFLAMNILELATEEEKDAYKVLTEVVEIYNRRLADVEIDLSLQVQLR